MSGKRHHINPRFLLEGFVSSSHKNRKHTWVFQRDKEPFHADIINVGAESNFYTHDDLDADNAITEIEPIFADLLDGIRARQETALSSPSLPRMIAHFEIRSKHLRDHLSQGYEIFMSNILDFIGDGESLANKLKDLVCRNSPLVQEGIQATLKGNNLPQEMLTPFLMLGPNLIDQRQHLPEGFPESIRNFIHEHTTAREETTQSSHIKSIQSSPASKTRARKYEHLIYSIVKKHDGMILGDFPLLFHVNSEEQYKTILDTDDELIAVYLPIDSESVLVGAHQRERVIPDDFLKIVAQCSLEYFIASENTETNQKLQGKIGANSNLFTKEEKKKFIDEPLFEKRLYREITPTPVYSYIGEIKEKNGIPAILLALETMWGYQGFILDRKMAENLSQTLLGLSQEIRQKHKIT